MTTQVQPADKTLLANGLNIHYLDWGNPDKPTIVLLHGLRGHAHSWDSFSAAVCGDYHVIAVDQRGRGDADWAKDGDYSPGAYVDDMSAFYDGLGLSPIILIGHSMGARAGMGFTARHPEKVAKLVIVDAPPGNMPDGDRIRGEIRGTPEEFASFEDAFAHVRKSNPLPPEDVLRRRVRYQTRQLPNGKVGWKYDLVIREIFRRPAGPAGPGFWDAWRTISCPTLIVRGTETDALTPEAAQEMVESVPNASLREVPKAAHMVMEENPDGFLEAVSSWLG